jgi:alpha-L-rhamnosidase
MLRNEDNHMTTTLTPQRLRCNYLVNPLAVDAARPRLSWTVIANGRGRRQTAYRILVASSPDILARDRGDLWDTGRVVNDRTSQIEYAGRELSEGKRAWWTVHVWDENGRQSTAGETAWWERGLTQDGWHGKWIGLDVWNGQHMPAKPAPGESPTASATLAGLIPSPYLRTELRVDGAIRRARVYVTAKGLYELHLNGTRVGDRLLTPGWTDYDRRIQYQAYDITDLLQQGENVLGAILAPGWYSGYVGMGGRCRHYGACPQLMLEGRVEYSDGHVQVVSSGDEWSGNFGPLRHADLLMGEHYDARLTLADWDRCGSPSDDWRPVIVTPRTGTPLVADPAEPVQIVEELVPVAITESSPGSVIVDLGQNIAGWTRLRVRGAAGTRIQMRYAEVLTPEVALYLENLRAARATDVYVLAGEGEEFYEPRFTFHGFRYIEVTGYPGTLTTDDITGCAVASNTPPAGSFECSSALVNQLQHNIEWGQRGNFLSIPTDCPQRDERLGWTGDGQIFVGTACYNRDVAAFYTKWMQDVEDGQAISGAFPEVAPRLIVMEDGSPAWGDAGVIVPWTLYRAYGDIAVVRRHYAAMTRWMGFLEQANPEYLRLGRLGNNFGDWLALDAATPSDVLATAYWAYDAKLMAEMADAIGEGQGARRYADLFKRIKASFIAAYVDDEGHVAGRTQTAYVVALHMDLVPAQLRPAAAGHLVEDIKRRDWHLSTGFVGVGHLCPVLAETGHVDVAYRLLTCDTFPSWGFSIREGATTIWERWDGYTRERGFQTPEMNSFNHYSLGSVGEWLYRYVAGISTDPCAPGFARTVVRPHPGGGLTSARATYISMHGPIEVQWAIRDACFTLELTIPANTSATVHIPTAEPASVQEGGLPLARAAGVHLIEQHEDRTVVTVESGVYRFTATLLI